VDALFVYNPTAGEANVSRELDAGLARLAREGWHVDLLLTSGRGHATDIAARAAEDGVDLVVAVGGDGTVNEVANGLVGTRTILGVIPAGTTNVWAAQLGIPSLPPLHPRKVAARVLADLHERGWKAALGIQSWLSQSLDVLQGCDVRAVDVGSVNGRHFLLWCGLGFDATVTESVMPEDKRRFGVLAYVASGFSIAVDYTGARMHLNIDGHEIEEEVLMVVVANARLYGRIFNMAPRAYLDDGLLDVRIFKGEGLGSTIKHLTAVLAGRQVEEAGDVDYLQAKKIRVGSIPTQPVHADDEVFATTPADIEVKAGALNVLVAPDVDQSIFCRPKLGKLADFV